LYHASQAQGYCEEQGSCQKETPILRIKFVEILFQGRDHTDAGVHESYCQQEEDYRGLQSHDFLGLDLELVIGFANKKVCYIRFNLQSAHATVDQEPTVKACVYDKRGYGSYADVLDPPVHLLLFSGKHEVLVNSDFSPLDFNLFF
jgi:hypothetical protein